jgi:hypothetical protein
MAQEGTRLPCFRAKDFDGDQAMQVHILGLIHRCHATGGEWLKDAVVSDYVTGQLGRLLHDRLFLSLL